MNPSSGSVLEKSDLAIPQGTHKLKVIYFFPGRVFQNPNWATSSTLGQNGQCLSSLMEVMTSSHPIGGSSALLSGVIDWLAQKERGGSRRYGPLSNWRPLIVKRGSHNSHLFIMQFLIILHFWRGNLNCQYGIRTMTDLFCFQLEGVIGHSSQSTLPMGLPKRPQSVLVVSFVWHSGVGRKGGPCLVPGQRCEGEVKTKSSQH